MPKLPAEAIKFAKSMGLDLNGLEPEAEDIWKMLDDMSTRDPLQYEAFVSQQFDNAKEGTEKSSKADDDKRSFRPVGKMMYHFHCSPHSHLIFLIHFINLLRSWLLCGNDHFVR